ncbi:hypothetical protein AMAG_13894 [Allomyces macrogynus ATCC 38327]|uniref:Protein phosphatase 1 regulatory subunit 21 N-terminal domain-containing protein n=1 Tax=Allomyces macrogynus (strain ATCC 38327) TaxID=578462 RepID=A0A0L0T377_ALLM3|nr:hypothetical protein AMAG_13894 [Allomyces macrogynus ATCC 38327]|eukprot:KNE69019.1 hypothetical protein AMAG_13894 [Allomyces macrogynus ATCC 38327]
MATPSSSPPLVNGELAHVPASVRSAPVPSAHHAHDQSDRPSSVKTAWSAWTGWSGFGNGTTTTTTTALRSPTATAAAMALPDSPSDPMTQLTVQLGCVKAQTVLLKKALVDERAKAAALKAAAAEHDTRARAAAGQLDALTFHNSVLTTRIEQLQKELAAASGAGRVGRSLAGWLNGTPSTATVGDPDHVRPASASPSLGHTASAHRELESTRTLLETTAQELQRKILENETLQSELYDLRLGRDQTVADLHARVARAEAELQQARELVGSMQVDRQEQQRLHDEIASVTDKMAFLNSALRDKDAELVEQRSRAEQDEVKWRDLASHLRSDRTVKTLVAEAIAQVHGRLRARAADVLSSYALVLEGELLDAPEDRMTALAELLDQVSTHATLTSSSAGPVWVFSEQLLTRYSALCGGNGNTKPIDRVLMQIRARKVPRLDDWRALTAHFSAHVQLTMATQPSVAPLCAGVVAALAALGTELDVYAQLVGDDADDGFARASSPARAPRDDVEAAWARLVYVAGFQQSQLAALQSKPSTRDQGTQLALADIPHAHFTVSTQTPAPPTLATSSTQSDPPPTTRATGMQTEGRVRTFDSRLQKLDVDRVSPASVPPAAVATGVAVAAIDRMWRRIQRAEARANMAEMTAAKGEEVGKLEAALAEAKEREEVVAQQYQEQIGVLTDEVCRLQEVVAGAVASPVERGG